MSSTPKSTLATMDLHGKRVFLRADLNVPLANATITDTYRLKKIMPTINSIQKKGGRIILATHIGRPGKPGAPRISTKILEPWLIKQGLTVIHEHDIPASISLEEQSHNLKNNEILLLENLRFHPGEKKQDALFAQKLAALGDIYVDDAFAALHRNDTSITLVPTLFDTDNKTIGLLVEHELAQLEKLQTTHRRPFIALLGGGKVAGKLPRIPGLLAYIDTLILCPALVFTFLKAQGISVGNSLVDENEYATCRSIMHQANQHNVQIVVPVDYLISTNNKAPVDGPFTYCSADAIPDTATALSIGPKSIQLFSEHIKDAGSIFFNAAMGFANNPETMRATYALLKAIGKADAFSVVGGGSSVAAARHAGLESEIDFLSTGGGATLTYVSGAPLPGLEAVMPLKDRTKT